jgi:flagella basal body P-ring formation protein FlgA
MSLGRNTPSIINASGRLMTTPTQDTDQGDNRLIKMRYLEPDEYGRLRAAHIYSVEELWPRLGDDFDQGIDQIATEMYVSPARLSTSLIDELLGEMQFRHKSAPYLFWRWVRLHFLDTVLVAGVAVLALLSLRAAGYLSALPEPFGLKQKFLVAARDLEPGHLLKAGDLYGTLLASSNDYFTDPAQLGGAVILKRVPQQKPLRNQDVSRLQVIAATDIPAGTQINPQLVKLEWSPYDPDAFLKTDQVTGCVASRPLHGGAVISKEGVTQNTAPPEGGDAQHD